MSIVHSSFLFLAILLIVLPASAGIVETSTELVEVVNESVEITNFVLDLLSQKNWDRDWSVAANEGTPVKNTKSSGGITAWIDITGFRNMSIIDNVSYVNGEAKDFAIVKRGAKYGGIDGTMTSFKSVCTVTDCNVTNTTTATQTTTLKYEECHTVHTTTESSRDHTVCTTYTSVLIVSCTVDSPKNFTTRMPDINTAITVFNRSFEPVTYINIPTANHSSMKDVMVVVVDYNGSKVIRYDQIGWVFKNDRGCEHVEFIDDRLPMWIKEGDQSMIYHCGRLVVVSVENFNISKLNISIHTPYETMYVSNYTVGEISGSTVVSVPILWTILIIIVSMIGLIVIWKVVICVM